MHLIDTHQHLILRKHLGYAWTEGVADLVGDFTLADYAALVEGRVDATVFMETGVDEADYKAEARLVSGLIGPREGCPPLLAQISACRPETDDGFDAWLEECSDLGVVGFRRLMQTMPDEMSSHDTYRQNIRKIGAAGWPVDLCCAARQLDIAAELVRACPNVRFILDHCGTNDLGRDKFAAWRDCMMRLAELPNLHIKFSGVTAYVPADAGPADPVNAVLDTVLELFGPARLIWGGDWPVVDLGIGLPAWIDLTTRLMAPLSPTEQAQIGHSNAREFYNLPQHSA